MFHRIGAAGAVLHRMDWDNAAALMRKALGWTALAGTAFLLCKAQVVPMLAPFAMAFLAAALLMGRNIAALLTGCVAGALGATLSDFNLRLPVGAAVVLIGGICRDLLLPELRERLAGNGVLSRAAARLGMRRPMSGNTAPRRQARSPNRSAAVACATLAGLGVLVPGLVCAGGELWPSVEVAAASVTAVASAPFFRAALGVTRERRRLSQEERIGLFLLAGALTAGLFRLWRPLGFCAGLAAAQLMYPCGALAGAGFGAALLLMGGEVRLLALTTLGGAAAQVCGGLSRSARAGTVCAMSLAAALPLGVPSAMLAAVGASALSAVALPGKWADAAAELSGPVPPACDPQRLAERVRRQSSAQLRALSAAFGDLAEGYLTPPRLPDEQALINRMRERLCDGCGSYGACWTGEPERGARFLCGLITEAVALPDDAPLFEGEAPPELLRRCRRGRLIPERLQYILEDFARTRRSELKRGSENRLISAQFLQAKELLEGLAEEQARPLKLRARQAERAACALEQAGIPTESVMALGGAGVEILATLKRGEGRWTPELARAASERLSRAFGREYAVGGTLGRELRLVRRPRLRPRTGVVCASREAGALSGDSHLVCMLDEERLLVLICDGMGSGEAAARESAMAVRLLGRFLKAGARCGLAIETVNALLLNRSSDDMFATVDMLVVNLSTGDAEFTKLAACPTLIARDGEVARIEGGRLPLGILERVQPGTTRTRLIPGDVLLMASDGVMDAAGGQALEALLADTVDMPELARRAVDAARSACADGRLDDMTAVCLRVG